MLYNKYKYTIDQELTDSKYGITCLDVSIVPWWLGQPGAKHPVKIFDQNYQFIKVLLFLPCYSYGLFVSMT